MRILTFLLLMLLGTSMLGLAALKDPGYIYISRGNWSAESSLFVLLAAFILFYLVFYVIVRTISGFFSIPSIWQHWHERSLNKRACGLTQRGLIALAEGHWEEAERDLIKLAEHSDTPLINYLGAARAAQKNGDGEKRDHYLAEAYHSMPDAKLAVGLTQADVQLSEGEFESALATLRELRTLAPRHTHVLYMLHKLYLRLESWSDLLELLPELRRHHVLDEDKLEALELKLHVHTLQQAITSKDEGELDACWKHIPKPLQVRHELLLPYANALHRLKHDDQAEELLRSALEQQLEAPVARLYGLIVSSDSAHQLSHAEGWLKQNPNHPELLLSCGRIALRNRLWGKARSYLEASIARTPSAESYRELGDLLNQLNESAAACEAYRKGLILAEQ